MTIFKSRTSFRLAILAFAAVSVFLSAGCVPKVATPDMLSAPVPQQDANGEYISAYTSDGVMCEWTDKMANVGLGARIGSTVATIAAQQAMKSIPMFGALLGPLADRAGEAIGRKIAIETVGGWDYIKSKSDMSFVTADDLVLHMYVTYCHNEHYNSALAALKELYPELKRDNSAKFNQILLAATKDLCANDNPKCIKISDLPSFCGTGKVPSQIPVNLQQAVSEPAATDPAATPAPQAAETTPPTPAPQAAETVSSTPAPQAAETVSSTPAPQTISTATSAKKQTTNSKSKKKKKKVPSSTE